jgi:hypothetical protein
MGRTSSIPTEVAQQFLDNGLKTLKALGHDLDEAPRPARSNPAIGVLQLRLLALRAQISRFSSCSRSASTASATAAMPMATSSARSGPIAGRKKS